MSAYIGFHGAQVWVTSAEVNSSFFFGYIGQGFYPANTTSPAPPPPVSSSTIFSVRFFPDTTLAVSYPKTLRQYPQY